MNNDLIYHGNPMEWKENIKSSSQIIDALEKLKDETMDAIVKFGIEKSIECIRKIEEENK